MGKREIIVVHHISVLLCCWTVLANIGVLELHWIYGTRSTRNKHMYIYYMEESVLLGTKPLVDSIRHFIRDPSGVFPVCHLCECRIVQWRHDSRHLLLLPELVSPYNKKNITRWLEDIWILRSRGKNTCHSNIKFISSRHRVISSIYKY